MAEVNVTGLTTNSGSYVEWKAILAGAVMALALSFILLTFGSAVGFSAVSPWSVTTSGKLFGLGAAFWVLLVQVWSFALGGYFVGRLRHRWQDAVANEVEFRDGAHGLLVWGTAVVLAGAIAASTIGSVAKTGIDAAATSKYDLGNPLILAVDTMFRPMTPTSDSRLDIRNDEARAEAARILVSATTREGILSTDRAYLSKLVSVRTGIPPADADTRVANAIDQLKQAADKARKLAILVGFLTAASLLIGAGAAWWAAELGGKHRDAGTIWHGFGRHDNALASKVSSRLP